MTYGKMTNHPRPATSLAVFNLLSSLCVRVQYHPISGISSLYIVRGSGPLPARKQPQTMSMQLSVQVLAALLAAFNSLTGGHHLLCLQKQLSVCAVAP